MSSGSGSRASLREVGLRALRGWTDDFRLWVIVVAGVVLLVGGIGEGEVIPAISGLGMVLCPIALMLFRARGELDDEWGLGRQRFDLADWLVIFVVIGAIVGLLVAAVAAA
jgi:hypothetical protein